MGTLIDDTAQANKENSPPSNSLMPSNVTYPLVQQNGLGKDSPHFMTPTFASKRAEAEKSNDRASTPTSVLPIKSDGGKTLLKSAAKRVGFRRAGDGTPRSKKEGTPKQSIVVPFPDKVRNSVPRECNSS